jgi:CheY-like chemotaxis protein
MKKAKSQYPDLKVIIITGKEDRNIRRDAAAVGADGFLLKPLDLADFLDIVERCLGVVESIMPAPGLAEPEGPDKPKVSLSEFLTQLRQDLNATSVVLLADSGVVLARAGDFPDTSFEGLIIPALVAVFSTGATLSKLLRAEPPMAFQFFSGPEYDLILTQVGESYALLHVLDSINVQKNLSDIVSLLHAGVVDLLEILAEIGVTLNVEDQPISVEDEYIDEVALAEETPIIDALFQQGAENLLKPDEVDAFWDSISKNETTNDLSNADVLTYFQALKLGLAPDEEESEDD